MNRVRGLLSEFGIVMPLQAKTVKRETREHMDQLPPLARSAIEDLLSEICALDERIDQYDKQLRQLANGSA